MVVPIWQIIEAAHFARRKKWLLILLAAVAVVGVTAIVFKPNFSTGNPNVSWWNWAEPIMGTSTLCVALAVWFGDVYREWEEDLPKRLTVQYFYKGQPLLVCKDVYLSGEGDIRALAQQIGGQMTGVPKLSFDPYIKQDPGEVRRDKKNTAYKHYSVELILTELPQEESKKDKREGDDAGKESAESPPSEPNGSEDNNAKNEERKKKWQNIFKDREMYVWKSRDTVSIEKALVSVDEYLDL